MVTQQSERKGRGQNGLPSQKVAVTNLPLVRHFLFYFISICSFFVVILNITYRFAFVLSFYFTHAYTYVYFIYISCFRIQYYYIYACLFLELASRFDISRTRLYRLEHFVRHETTMYECAYSNVYTITRQIEKSRERERENYMCVMYMYKPRGKVLSGNDFNDHIYIYICIYT